MTSRDFAPLETMKAASVEHIPTPLKESPSKVATSAGCILFVAANPLTTDRVQLDQEARDIEQKIRASEHRDFFSLKTRWAATVDDLLQALLEDKPGVVHFSGHGNADPPGIVLHGENGGHQLVSADVLKNIFACSGDHVRVVVLNCCHSEQQALAISEVVDYVVGTTRAISDEAARTFSASFYRGLGFGRCVRTSFRMGWTAVSALRCGEEGSLRLWAKDDAPLFPFFLPTEDAPEATYRGGSYGVEHQEAARPIHVQTIRKFTTIALVCIFGGIVAIVSRATGASSELSLFGLLVRTESVGVALVGIGVGFAYFSVRTVHKNMYELAQLPPEASRDDATTHHTRARSGPSALRVKDAERRTPRR